MTDKQIKAGRRWAYGTMLVMLALSVAGNLAHTFHINPGAGLRAQLYAIIWPLCAWVGIELFVRIPWQPIFTHRAVRWGGIGLAALIAGIVSYNHLSGLLKADREDWIVYTIGPLAVDGLLFMSTLGLLLTRALTDKAETFIPEPVPASEREQYAAELAELRSQIHARPVPASREVREHEQTRGPLGPYVTTGNGKTEGLKLADLLPAPVSPAPAIPGLQLGEPIKLPGWEAPVAVTSVKPRAPRTSWDQGKARKMILEGATKAEVAEAVGKDVKTIQRLRKRMVDAGELSA